MDILFTWARRMGQIKSLVWPDGILIHTLELKLWLFKVSICLYRKPCICNVCPLRVRGVR